MSVLAVGLSHKSAPVATLERAVVTGDSVAKLLRDAYHGDDVAGTFVVSTCNRVEVYAEVGPVPRRRGRVCELLVRHSGMPPPSSRRTSTCTTRTARCSTCWPWPAGSSSMVVGESQILGQVRESLKAGPRAGHPRPGDWPTSARLALRTRASARMRRPASAGPGASLVSVGLTAAAEQLGVRRPGRIDRPAGRGAQVLVVGAGSSGLAGGIGGRAAGAARMASPTVPRSKPERLADTVGGTVSRPDRAARPDRGCGPGHLLYRRGRACHQRAASWAARCRCASRRAPLVLLDLALPGTSMRPLPSCPAWP